VKIPPRLSIVAWWSVAVVCASTAGAIDITTGGGWTETVDQTDLTSGAGSDLNDAYESLATASSVNVTTTTGDSDNWRVDVRRSDAGWHGDLSVYISRTSDGTGTGSISGGTTYMVVGASDTAFFSGAGDRTGIDVQYKVTGMSVQVDPASYGTTITLTVVDTP
jgi:hypothetical protein